MRSPNRWWGRLLGVALAVLHPGVLAGQGSLPESIARQVDAVFARYDRPDSPGCALGVYRGGRMVYAKGYGSAHLELGVKLTAASVFDIGSTSKQFTALSVLLLAREGKLALDDDVRKYVPELRNYGRTITIRHLLHHTSGLRDYTTLLVLAGERVQNVTTEADALDMIARQQALNFAPGSQWEYSNSGFFLLSIIVKRVSGESLRRFAQARIFGPLGMERTHVHDDHAMVVANRAVGYLPGDSTGAFRIEMSNWEQTGDGSVLTTVEDLLRWDQNFYSTAVGGSEVRSEMVQPGSLNDGKALDYAAGLIIGEYRGLKTVAHGGSWAGYRAQLLRFPAQHTSVACLCNLGSADAGELALRVADVYLAGRLGPAKVTDAADSGPVATSSSPSLPPAQRPGAELLAGFKGEYYSPELQVTYRIRADSGKLVLHARNLPATALEPTIQYEFEHPTQGFSLRFSRARAQVTGFTLAADGIRGLHFERHRAARSR